MKKIISILILSLILFVSFGFAQTQPTQQFNKIFLDPFYRISMGAQDYEYSVTINPPDGFSDVISSIVTFQMWLNPTVEFFLLVDGQECNTASYEVHTTYAGAGEGTVFFDCSNIINKAGDYVITLTPDDDTGAVTGWIDLTYMNNPKGEFNLLGTEYSPGDPATIFLQLKDAQGSPVSDGACYIDIYNPLYNGTHSYYLEDAPMIFDENDDGLYYYDLTVPDVLGNYMLAAKCAYSYSTPLWVYGPTSQHFAIETRISDGTWTGDSQALNSKSDGLYEKCEASSSVQGCLTTWQWTLPTGDYSANDSVVNVYYSGQADLNELSSLSCLNITDGVSYIPFINQLTYSGEASEFSPIAIDDFLTNILIDDCINRSQTQPNITIEFYINKDKVNVYHNWLSLLVLAASGNIQDLKGSSEMHVVDIAKQSAQLTAPEVWGFENRTLTTVEYSISVLGTDYEVGDNGRAFIQLVRLGVAVDDAVCQLDVYKPSDVRTSIDYFIEDGLLLSLGENGLYYYDFIAPSEVGIYAVSADCSIGQNTTVFNASSDNLIEGSVVSGSLSDTFASDNVYYEIHEQDNGGGNRSYVHDFYFDFSSLPPIVNFAALLFEGRLTPSTPETIKFQVYNYTGGFFFDMPNELISQSGVTDIFVANTGSGECVDAGGDCQNASGFIRVRLQDTVQSGDTSTNIIRIDRMVAGVTHTVSAPVIGVSGGGEWNVRDRLTDITGRLFEINGTVYDINGTVTNQPERIWNYNSTINVNLLQQFAQTVWEFTYRYIHGEIQ